MSFVALQFEDNQILVAGARSNGKRLQVHSLFSVALTGDDVAVSESLKTQLTQHGLSRSDAILVISRADAEMRELEIPPAPDNEVPDMVRFIARNEFASLNENWALDYLIMKGDATQPRTVLAIGISPEVQKQQQAIATAAGLKIKHIVLRPFASLDLIRSRLTDQECRLIVDPNGDQTDLSIVDGDSILTTRTVRIPESDDPDARATALLSEVRRTLASSRKTLANRKISQVLMFGDAKSYKSLVGHLRSQLDLDVDFIDPLEVAPLDSGVEHPSESARYAALLGSLVQHNSDAKHLIDFVNPRRPVVKQTDLSKWYLWGGIALAASLFVIVCGWWVLSSQTSAIAQLESRVSDLVKANAGDEKDEIPSTKQIMAEIELIDDWKAADVNWLHELSELSKRTLTPDDAIVDSLDAVAGLRSDINPRILITARINNVAQEKALNDELRARPYLVNSTRWTDSGDESYPLTSSLSVGFDRNRSETIREFDQKALEYLQNKVKNSQSSTGENDSPPTDN